MCLQPSIGSSYLYSQHTGDEEQPQLNKTLFKKPNSNKQKGWGTELGGRVLT